MGSGSVLVPTDQSCFALPLALVKETDEEAKFALLAAAWASIAQIKTTNIYLNLTFW